MPYNMRKRIKNNSDVSSSDSDNSDDEDYTPFGDSISLKEFNKNIQEFNKHHHRITMIAKIAWFIRNLIIIISHILIAIFCSDYLYGIIKPESLNFYTIFVIFISITNISLIQIYIKKYYKSLLKK